jgi:hypothetical protein
MKKLNSNREQSLILDYNFPAPPFQNVLSSPSTDPSYNTTSHTKYLQRKKTYQPNPIPTHRKCVKSTIHAISAAAVLSTAHHRLQSVTHATKVRSSVAKPPATARTQASRAGQTLMSRVIAPSVRMRRILMGVIIRIHVDDAVVVVRVVPLVPGEVGGGARGLLGRWVFITR